MMGGWGLSEREYEVWKRIAKGMPHKQIATELGIAIHTIKNHSHNIRSKLGVDRNEDLIVKWYQEGMGTMSRQLRDESTGLSYSMATALVDDLATSLPTVIDDWSLIPLGTDIEDHDKGLWSIVMCNPYTGVPVAVFTTSLQVEQYISERKTRAQR